MRRGMGFAATVIDHLEPVLAPRGFRSQNARDDDRAVLFHCEGHDVGRVLQRYPSWQELLVGSYGQRDIPCLDLWVKHDGHRTWSFEIFDRDVAAAAGSAAMRRLDDLQDAPLDAWVAQLAEVFEAYFMNLDRE